MKVAGVAGEDFTVGGNVGEESGGGSIGGGEPGSDPAYGIRGRNVVTKEIVAGGDEAVGIGVGRGGNIVTHQGDVGRIGALGGLRD